VTVTDGMKWLAPIGTLAPEPAVLLALAPAVFAAR